jgi:monoamine oxidase
MKRRTLLAWLAAAGVTPLSDRSLIAADPPASGKHQVIVVGAGMAGLAAARHLRSQDQEVLILEARDRVGGRLWTSQKWPDAPVDLGASWIHGVTGNPITDLADEAETDRLETSYDRSIIYDSNGQPITGKRESELERLMEKLHQALRKAQDSDSDSSVRNVVEGLAQKSKLDEPTLHLLNFLVSSEIEQEYAGSASRLSAHWFDTAKTFGGEDALFAEGYQVIVDLLSEGQSIRVGEIVNRIDWSSDAVKVLTSRGEYSADKVLVTLPLGALKSGKVEFVPQLPRTKSNAISKLEMGHLNKCYLRFPEVFWPKDVDWLEYIPRDHGTWTEWVSFANAADKPILLGFNAGDRGRDIETWTDAQIVDSAMKTLRTIFGTKIPNPIDYQITRWSSDPFALGAYSFNPVGSHPKLRRQLSEPIENKLYFAGEATERDYFATAHGAYLSGIRAAKEILG